jgi:hypothetical protein
MINFVVEIWKKVSLIWIQIFKFIQVFSCLQAK